LDAAAKPWLKYRTPPSAGTPNFFIRSTKIALIQKTTVIGAASCQPSARLCGLGRPSSHSLGNETRIRASYVSGSPIETVRRK